ncbi:PASTA domain-containing protein [Nakamurella alba]|nr:PASTA domain-containing protein [Nakamurella alba]
MDPLEEDLRRMLAARARAEVPDDTPVPRFVPPDRRDRRPSWLLMAGVAAAVVAVVLTVTLLPRGGSPGAVGGPGSTGGAVPPSQTAASRTTPPSGTGTNGSTTETTALPSTPPRSTPPRSTPTPTGTGTATVPGGLVGLSWEVAEQRLVDAGLQPYKITVGSPLPVDEVILLEGVSAGEEVAAGLSVGVAVSDSSLFVMPDLVNTTLDQAAQMLQSLGWTGSADSLVISPVEVVNTAQIGVIVSDAAACQAATSPMGGYNLPKNGSTIRVCVGTPKMLSIEPVAGLTVYEAVQTLRDRGFTFVSAVNVQLTPPLGQGNRVLDTDPAAGTVVRFDTPIVVRVYPSS